MISVVRIRRLFLAASTFLWISSLTSLGQRILGVGTVCVISSDKSVPHLDLVNVKHPREVKELIHKNVEAAKDKRRMRTTEIMGGPEDDEFAHDFDDETECGSH